MDAITLLRDDHKQVERMFKSLERDDDLEVVPDICDALTMHAMIEEAIFYPAVRAEVEDAADEIGESVEEHHIAKLLIAELEQLSAEDETYRSKAIVLMEMVRHHVEEEEGELFPMVREALGRKRLQELGQQMKDMKEQRAAA